MSGTEIFLWIIGIAAVALFGYGAWSTLIKLVNEALDIFFGDRR